MNNNTNYSVLNQLMKEQSSAKTKMVLGIVFLSIAFFVEIIGSCLTIMIYDYDVVMFGYVMIILSLPFWGVGIPFLIKGITGLVKANRKISQFRRNQNTSAQPQYSAPQPQYAPPQYPQPQYAAPQPQYTQPQYAQPQQGYAPVQNNAYAAQPVTQAWTCPSCGAQNDTGKFCASCGAPRG